MRRWLHLVFNLVPASEGSCNLSFTEFSVSQEVTFEDNRKASSNDRRQKNYSLIIYVLRYFV
jgi:hypothetical protein